MSDNRVYNFAAGPSMMPEAVLKRAGEEICNFRGTGMSVMEMSHRSPAFADIFKETKQKLRDALSIPDNYAILMLQGGATLQFSSIPLNFMGEKRVADYAVTGNFSGIAARQARKYGTVNIACDTSDEDHSYIPDNSSLKLTPGASYFHYCANNTIYGTEWQYVPETNGVPIACDMSSDILSKPIDVSRYGLIYAGAQKNMAPAGLTVVIVDKSLAGHQMNICPDVMSYDTLIKKDSMLNTPPCWCIYMLSLMLDWLESIGGVNAMAQIKKERSKIVYDVLDESKLYIPHARRDCRSDMNVTFRTPSDELDAEFVKGAAERGMVNLKGHRLTGGIRASLYNAMPIEGAKALAEYMKDFEAKHHV